MSSVDEKTLKKAEGAFLKFLKDADTSNGPAEEVILKFYLTPEVESAFDELVQGYGCTMSTRIISREEQDAIDSRRKTCAQYTNVVVTPEAQAAFLKDGKVPSSVPGFASNKSSKSKKAPSVTAPLTKRTRKPSPKKAASAKAAAAKSDPRPRKRIGPRPVKEPQPQESVSDDEVDDDDDEQVATMPLELYESLCDQLTGITNELRKYKPVPSSSLKRRLEDDGAGTPRSSKKPRRSRG
ncbi:hypothetical protein FB45DRAFT_900614 [Roridomyces roridus]|uniref:Uncharacterized protein n=1 Tax=Roridomyces roridus TaxID=1738132 RepID=A0AAD7C7U6_9AGAR|nr:hypothetical protein FB45DRAFT_900614 [Roridomyces roridus]